MTKVDNGIWQVTVGPIPPGAYRYNFNVDGIPVIDPRNPLTSQSNMNTWSLFYVAGSDYMDTKDVPHGAISQITYYSNSLHRFRRMHIYTPPGYQAGKGTYPVFYLLHGAFDCDDAWPSVGRAGFILDNLLAQNKAKPMVVVMPAGHTGPFRFGEPLSSADEFLMDFVNDVKPYVETNYRVYTDRKHRAVAGLSMGGAQALNISMHDLEKYGYIGVFSSGILGITGDNKFGPEAIPVWEERNQSTLNNEVAKKGLQLIWFSIGKDDFLLDTSRKTVEMLKKHGFTVVYKETSGGHTWINWRNYLIEFAQLLFQ
jgi:enterochelin esterase-like enzyme